jgi:hypothetical protein
MFNPKNKYYNERILMFETDMLNIVMYTLEWDMNLLIYTTFTKVIQAIN